MSKFVKNSIVSIITTFGGGIINYGFHFIVSRKLSVAEYGILQSLIAVSAIVGIFGNALSNYALKHTSVFAVNNQKRESARFISSNLKSIFYLSMGFMIPYLLAVPFIGSILKISNLYGLYIIGLGIYVSFVSVFYGGVLSGWQLFVDMNIYSILSSIIKLIIGILIAYLMPSGSLLIVSFVVASVFLALGFAHILKKHELITVNINVDEVLIQNKLEANNIFEKSFIPVFIFSTLIILLNNIDTLAVKAYCSAELSGYFGAFNMIGKIIFWVNGSILAVFIPSVFASAGRGEKVKIQKIIQIYFCIIFIGAGAILIYSYFPQIVLGTLFGSKYLKDKDILSVYGYVGTVFSLFMLEANIAFARKKYLVSIIIALSVISIIGGMQLIILSLKNIGQFLGFVFLISFIICVFYNNYSHYSRKLS